jgi:hypothetical protein
MTEQISTGLRRDLEKNLRFSRMVILGLLAMIGLVVAGTRFLPFQPPSAEAATLIQPIYIGVIITGFLVVIVRRLVLSSLVLGASRTRGVEAVWRTMALLSFFSGAVAVAMALAGLLVCLLTGDYQHCLRLGGVGGLLALYSLPRRREWQAAVSGLD